MSIKFTQKSFPNKMIDFDTFNKNCLRMCGDLGKLIVAKGLKKLPISNKLPNLVTLVTNYIESYVGTN